MRLSARGSRLPDTNKHKQLTPHKGRKVKRQIEFAFNKNDTAKRFAADVSVRPILYIWKLSRFLAENKRKPYFRKKYT